MPDTPPSPLPHHRRDRSKAVFVASSFALVFLYGVAVGTFNVFPYAALNFGFNAVRDLRANWRTDLGLRPVFFLEPARYPGSGVTRHVAAQMRPGLTLLAGFFDRQNELRLIRADGTVVRRWPVRFSTLFPNPTYVQPAKAIPRSEWNIDLHDAVALTDGSVVFNFEGVGMAKLGRCGEVVWTVPRMVHHAISPTADGGFWVGSRTYVTGQSPYPHLRTPFYDETVMKVSATGEVVNEISVLDAVIRDYPGVFYGNATFDVPNGDMIHLNDVEELPRSLADRFPRFSTGDLLVSLRGVSMLLVLNPVTRHVVWTQLGPWIRQHDPDFLPSGHISVFSNNTLDGGEAAAEGTEMPDPLGASTILDLDPNTGTTSRVYGGVASQPMYSAFRGKHDVLDNGNLLIVEANAGRVIETNARGEIVWEFINRFDDADAAVVYQARRYPDEYFTTGDWSCR